MKEFQAAYLPIGVPTFHLESAQAEFEASVHTLKEITEQVVCPDEMLLSLEKLDAFLDRLHPDLLILQNDSITIPHPLRGSPLCTRGPFIFALCGALFTGRAYPASPV